MPVLIERPSVSFTNEAEIALNRSVADLERRIRVMAADAALQSRGGTSAEVTASDVERAYLELLRFDTPESGVLSERRLRRSYMLTLLSTVYQVLGLFIVVAGTVYPYVHSRLINPAFRFSVVTVLAGLVLAFAGFFIKEYARQRQVAMQEELLKRYIQVSNRNATIGDLSPSGLDHSQ